MWNMDHGGSSEQLELLFTVSEGVPIGTFIGVIRSTNTSVPVEPPFLIVPISGGDLFNNNNNAKARIPTASHMAPYAFESQIAPTGTVDTDLNIDQSTGEIRTAIELDREQRTHYSFIAISLTGINVYVKIVSDQLRTALT